MLFNIAYIGPATTAEEALERLASYHGPLAIDTETIGLKGDKAVVMDDWDDEGNVVSVKAFLDARTCIGIGVAISETEGFYFPLSRPGWKNVPRCDPYPVIRKLEDEGCTKVFFNSMFDLDVLDTAFEIEIGNFEDVAIACQVQGLWNSLDQNSGHLLGEDHVVIDEVLPKGKTMLDVSFLTTARKCIEDCLTTFKLYRLMRMQEWREHNSLTWRDHVSRDFDVSPEIITCYEVDRNLVPVLRKMSKRGLAVRQDVVKHWQVKLAKELEYYDDFFGQQGINPASNDQVGWLLVNRGLWVPQTESGKHLKVDEEVLRGLKHPLAHMVMARRRRQKLKSTYVDPFIGIERAYTHFRLDLATGRLGSWGFNSQNVPPAMRSIFAPDSTEWSWADLHQAEMRVWAYQSKDEVMLKAFEDGVSPHVVTLKTLFPGVLKSNADGSSTWQYVASKSYNFALLADASAEVLALTTQQPVVVVQKFKDELYTLYWKSKEHQDYMRQRHRPDFYPDWVETDFGRRCHIPDGAEATYTHQEKCRLNYPFQGSVADYIKRGMLGLNAIGMDFPIQVHDEILQDGVEEFPSWLADLHPAIPMPFEVARGEVWV